MIHVKYYRILLWYMFIVYNQDITKVYTVTSIVMAREIDNVEKIIYRKY